jgi:hypothetical protein
MGSRLVVWLILNARRATMDTGHGLQERRVSIGLLQSAPFDCETMFAVASREVIATGS